MNSLKIPDNGVMLKGAAPKDVGPLPPQAFAISLNDSVIEGMIKCVQDGGDISLALGAKPVSCGRDGRRFSSPAQIVPSGSRLSCRLPRMVLGALQYPRWAVWKRLCVRFCLVWLVGDGNTRLNWK